jgi:PAS domain-containing protein
MDYPMALREMRRRNLPIWCETQIHRHVDGRRFDVEITNHAVIFDGRWARMMLVTDVTAAEAARRALAASERKFRSIFENAVVGIFRIKADGRPEIMNPACAKLHGFDTPAALLASVDDIASYYVDPTDRAEYLAAVQAPTKP